MLGIVAIIFGEEIVQSRKAGMPNASLLLYLKLNWHKYHKLPE
jgi:hypothetical protein